MLSTRTALAVATLIWAAAVATGIVLRPPLPVDETRYLTVAWEMWLRGDFLVPHLNGAPYSDKPPLLFWAINLAWALFGVNETAARAVPPLFALASIWLTAALARRLWPETRGVAGLAALMVAGAILFQLYGSLVMFDSALTAFVLAAVIGALDVWRRGGWRGWLLFGAALGAAILAKGPVALLLTLPAPLLAPLWMRAQRPRSWARWYGGLVAGVVLGAAIGLAWAIPAAFAGGPEYEQAILWRQTAGRVVKSFAHARPWWFFIVLLPVVFYPWIVWPPVWRGLRAFKGRGFDDGLKLCALWFVVVLAALSSVSGKQLHYLLPMIPVTSLFFARLAHAAARTLRMRDLAAPTLVAVAVGAGFAALPIAAPALAPRFRDAATIGALAGADPLWAVGLIVAALAIAFAARRSMGVAVVGVAAITLAAFIVVHVEAARTLLPRYDLRPLAAALGQSEADGIAVAGGYRGEFGFLGRLRSPVTVLEKSGFSDWLAAHPKGRLVMIYRDRPADPPWPPVSERLYRGRVLGVWRGREAAGSG